MAATWPANEMGKDEQYTGPMIRRLTTRRRVLITLAVAMLSVATAWWVLPWCVPVPDRLTRPLPVSPAFLSSDGRPLRQLLSADGQRVAQPVRFEELPESLIHATLAAEDR